MGFGDVMGFDEQELVRIRKSTGNLVGLTLSGPQQGDVLRTALKCSYGGESVFDAVQATYNLLERSVGPALQKAHDQGLIVIIKEALANGRLTSRNSSADFAPRLKILQAAADGIQSTIDAVSLGYVVSRPFVDIVLSGATTGKQLISNLGAVDIATLDTEREKQLESIVQEPAIYWKERSAMAWN
mmetsp:Transcript_31277/g.50508  ORF Transcript_31277/g.50508 Transcript_31277/m.50508 type:complete len:186 (-) Transcript_31277:60-617(-)